jgi:hypothetical protein
MDYYAGIDVSLNHSSVCVMDAAGKIVREAKVPSEPEALARFFGPNWPGRWCGSGSRPGPCHSGCTLA